MDEFIPGVSFHGRPMSTSQMLNLLALHVTLFNENITCSFCGSKLNSPMWRIYQQLSRPTSSVTFPQPLPIPQPLPAVHSQNSLSLTRLLHLICCHVLTLSKWLMSIFDRNSNETKLMRHWTEHWLPWSLCLHQFLHHLPLFRTLSTSFTRVFHLLQCQRTHSRTILLLMLS